ncbi:hypothetical protein AGOR_G00181810 [Albula goreensis]|uniref:phenylalanine 4-monooxygenase n=1 Tax=Albula goreensis TaxID=1534307 RepID=A0A8T3CXR0_9TELE|nr:hypothetical protein AGOR_G00181810 [Albula goreensis]
MDTSFRRKGSMYLEEEPTKGGVLSCIFSLREQVGALAKALRLFEEKGINLTHIESRPSRMNKQEYEFFISVDTACSKALDEVIDGLRTQISGHVHELSRSKQKDTSRLVLHSSALAVRQAQNGQGRACGTPLAKAAQSPAVNHGTDLRVALRQG